MVLIISLVLALVQARAGSGRMIFARLEQEERAALAENAVRQRLRILLAEAMTGQASGKTALSLDGTTTVLEEGDLAAKVSVNDVGGLVDLYFAAPALLDAVPGAKGLAQGRTAGMQQLAEGQRFPVTEATLAHFGVGADARRGMFAYVTQGGGPGPLNGGTVPLGLRAAVERLGLAGLLPTRAVAVRIKLAPRQDGLLP
ncbi:MAG: hypothetical protein U1E48_00340 [Paracoccaceae bacterium]